ncbi:hypothetical protein [Desulfovibrio litoralis]|uniref:DUF2269 domain-containing protein n=1 Tax=Desulfovibrio litoralis DSM 11393 TaxID=1121455 RepID=A0A1M7SFW0_9BACT|nr:hypothetical protein [Desulfovibrio litoralis]SHN57192.1 hypothetical protein SAMN02745728_00879 [Desulfovibrio litoralis DSM 11393]
MKISTQTQKWLKILHLLSVSFWIGGAVSIAILHLLRSETYALEGMLAGIDAASRIIDLVVVIIGGAVFTSLTGLFYSLFTPWGFVRHKWIIVKWATTIFCILFGTFYLGPWEQNMADLSLTLGNKAFVTPEYQWLRVRHLAFGSIQVFILMLLVLVSVLKPWRKKVSEK